MYPIMKRGDLVVVENAGFEFNPQNVDVGDIVVYKAHWPHYHIISNNKTLYIFKEGDAKDIQIRVLGELKTDKGVYKILEAEITESPTRPVIHRVIDKVEYNNKTYFIIKGDNNKIHDPELVSVNQIKKRVITINGYPLVIPYIGYLSIFVKEYWYLVILFIIIYYAYDYIREGKNEKSNT
ncbi:S26 family signal peptidase [Methanocaldococcus fervens]|uniref:S26 family signal peptidase n=1 Tax=Methanocaldococcus fervens TaxID=83171 RepID=UPI000A560ED1|nr:S26 family signal peptidase [Methanocaldococcus fervens]